MVVDVQFDLSDSKQNNRPSPTFHIKHIAPNIKCENMLKRAGSTH